MDGAGAAPGGCGHWQPAGRRGNISSPDCHHGHCRGAAPRDATGALIGGSPDGLALPGMGVPTRGRRRRLRLSPDRGSALATRRHRHRRRRRHRGSGLEWASPPIKGVRRAANVSEGEITLKDGMRVTTAARTLLDLGAVTPKRSNGLLNRRCGIGLSPCPNSRATPSAEVSRVEDLGKTDTKASSRREADGERRRNRLSPGCQGRCNARARTAGDGCPPGTNLSA
jgi:hypothetical protein